MRSTAFFLALLALSFPTAQAASPAASAPQATSQQPVSQQPVSRQTVVTTSGRGFPWGLLGVLGLMGLARRHPPRRVVMVAPPPDAPLASPDSVLPESEGSEQTDGWRADEQPHEPAVWPTTLPEPAEDWDEPAWAEPQGAEAWDEDDHLPPPADPDKPSERLAGQRSGGPDLSKPPGRR